MRRSPSAGLRQLLAAFAMMTALVLRSTMSAEAPTCMGWGGGKLRTDCAEGCDDGQFCVLVINGHYECMNYTDSAFTLLVLTHYESDEEAALKATDAQAESKIIALPHDDAYPLIANCYLYNVSALDLDPLTTQFALAGGLTFQSFVKSHVALITFDPAFLANQTQITNISLLNIQLTDANDNFATMFPPSVTRMDLTNDLIYDFPTQLAELSLLEELSLEANYISTLDAADVMDSLQTLNLASNSITEVTSSSTASMLTVLNLTDNRITNFEAVFPSLETLDLSNNSLTVIPTSVYNHSSLKHLYLSGDRSALLSKQFTEAQFEFLQALDIFNVTESDFNSDESCHSNNTRMLQDTVEVCLIASTLASSETVDTSSSSNTPAIVGAIAGAIAVIVLIAAFVWWRRRQVSKRFVAELDDPQLLPLLLKPTDIKTIKKISEGKHTVAYLSKYRKSQLLVSRRLPKGSTCPLQRKAFVNSIKLTAPFDHPNVVRLVGVTWTPKTDIQALFEYMSNGSVREYLVATNTSRDWTPQKLQIAVDVAEALVYLHSFAPPVFHGNLKTSNVLLSDSMQAKLSKVGSAQLKVEKDTNSTQESQSSHRTASSRWQSPEVLARGQGFDQASDVFSFGVLLSELDSHALPYEGARGANGEKLADSVILEMIATGSIHPSFGDACPLDLRSLAGRCLDQDPRSRPAAPEVAYVLRTIQKSLGW